MFQAHGNVSANRFTVTNLVIGNIGAAGSLDVDVAVPAGLVAAGQIGFAVPTDASFTAGLVGIIPCRATANNNIRLTFANASAGGIDPADTFDFTIFMFANAGALAAAV